MFRHDESVKSYLTATESAGCLRIVTDATALFSIETAGGISQADIVMPGNCPFRIIINSDAQYADLSADHALFTYTIYTLYAY